MTKEQKRDVWLKKTGEGGDFDYINQDGVSFNSPAQWLFIGILGGCGCGSAEDFGNEAIKLLEDFGREHGSRQIKVYEDRFYELLAHWFDSKGLLEHGSSIGGSWLDEKGEQVLKSILESKTAPKEITAPTLKDSLKEGV